MRGLRKPRKTWTYTLAAGCAAIALLLACSGETLRADGPNLAGTWKLNEKKSDDVRAKMQAARNQNQDQPQGQDAGGPGGNGGPGGDGGPGGMRGGPGRGGMMADFSQITIEQTATTAKVTGASGRVLAVLGPGADNSGAAPTHAASADDLPANSDAGPRPRRGPPPPAVAHWNGGQLVSESQNPRGGKMTRTYELSPDHSELFVSTKIENPNLSEPVTYRQVYDRAKAN